MKFQAAEGKNVLVTRQKRNSLLKSNSLLLQALSIEKQSGNSFATDIFAHAVEVHYSEKCLSMFFSFTSEGSLQLPWSHREPRCQDEKVKPS